MYNIIMDQTISTAYKYIAPAHRAIWRLDIIFWLGIIFWYANNPGYRTLADAQVYYLFVIILSIYHVVSEYRHPRPNELGLSAPNEARYWFAGFAVIITVLLLLVNVMMNKQSDLLWLLMALAATGAAYILRPKPVA